MLMSQSESGKDLNSNEEPREREDAQVGRRLRAMRDSIGAAKLLFFQVIARAVVAQIAEQFYLPPAARHRIEHQPGRDAQEGSKHQAGAENGSRQTRHE